MKSRRQTYLYWVIALTVVFGGVMVWHRYSQPRFHGKTMAEWLDETPRYKFTTEAGTPYEVETTLRFDEFNEVLATFGSKTVPPLLKELSNHDFITDHWSYKAIQSGWLPELIRAKLVASQERLRRRSILAASAIDSLGTNLIPAIPELEDFICRPEHNRTSFHVISILSLMGPPALPALHRSITSVPPNRRDYVEAAVRDIHLRNLSSSDPKVRQDSLLAMGESPYAKPGILVSVVDLLESPEQETRQRALGVLAQHLPAQEETSIAIYRAVEKQTTSDDPEMRRVATELLAKLNAPPQENRAATISNSRIQ